MKNLIARLMSMENPVQRYIDTPMEGRLPPQPNMDLGMTHIVRAILRLK
jgi:hypothetical protein